MRVNWLMLLPCRLTHGLFRDCRLQLMNNREALQHGVAPRPCAPPSRAGRAPDLAFGAAGRDRALTRADLEENGLVVGEFLRQLVPRPAAPKSDADGAGRGGNAALRE